MQCVHMAPSDLDVAALCTAALCLCWIGSPEQGESSRAMSGVKGLVLVAPVLGESTA